MGNFHRMDLGRLLLNNNAAAPSLTQYTFVNTTDQVEVVYQIEDPRDGTRQVTITRLFVSVFGVTGTSPQMKVSLQGVDASGNPDGTIKGGGTPASGLFTPTVAGGTWVTLDNAFTVNAGDRVSNVIAYNSGTLNGSNTPKFIYTSAGAAAGYPYSIQNVATVRTRTGSGQPVYGYGSAGAAYGFPVTGVTATALSTAAERALRFVVDPAFCRTFKVAGFEMMLTTPAAAKNINFLLYSGTTVQQTCTWDSDHVGSNANPRIVSGWFADSPLVTLQAGTEYRLSVAPQDATNNVALYQYDCAANADLDAFPGGLNWYQSNRATGGATAWTDLTTSRPWASLILTDMTPPLGFLANRAMTGGCSQ